MDPKEEALYLIKKVPQSQAIRIRVDCPTFVSDASELIREIFKWGYRCDVLKRDIRLTYKGRKRFIHHPATPEYAQWLSENARQHKLRLKKIIEDNRTPAQLDFLKEREMYLREKYNI